MDESTTPPEPDRGAVRRYLLFGLSLPERAIRSTVGVVSGAAHEATSLLIPQAFRDSKTYQVLIQQNLDFLVEKVGGVEREKEEGEEDPALENFVARKAVGNFVDAVGLLTFHISPFAIMAVLGDVAYGTNAYLKELAAELKRQGVIAEDSTINHVDDLLDAVGKASAESAQALATPPLSVEGLKETIAQTKAAVRSAGGPTNLIPKAELKRMWDEMHEIATREGVSVFTVSTAMTMHALGKVTQVGRGVLSSVKVAGSMLNRHVFDHYASSLQAVREQGVFRTLSMTCKPYVEAVWNNFASDRQTVTEDVVTGRMAGRFWRTLTGWFRKKKPEEETGDGDASLGA